MKRFCWLFWFVLLLLVSLTVEAVAQGVVSAVAPLAEPNAWRQIVDFLIANFVVPLLSLAASAVVGVLFAPKIGLVWVWLSKRNIELDQARQEQFEASSRKALEWAIATLFSHIERAGPEGWADPAIHREAKVKAKEYLVEKFPDAVKGALGTTELARVDDAAEPVMTRLLPKVVSEVAASPASPPAPAPTAVPVVEVGQKS